MNSTIELLNNDEDINEKLINFITNEFIQKNKNINCSLLELYQLFNVNCEINIFIKELRHLGIWTFKTTDTNEIKYKINIDNLKCHFKRL